MNTDQTRQRKRRFGLSARLLLLTVFFVMLSEVFIYAPSIGRFRLDYFEKRIAAAHLASLALEAPPDNMVSEQLRKQLLDHAGSLAIVLRLPGRKAMILQGKMPPRVDATFNIIGATFFKLIFDALETLAGDGERIIRVVGPSPRTPSVVVETVIPEGPLRDAMVGYSIRILALSIAISLFTAILVYLTLHALFVRPMRSLMAAMVSFSENPEDATRLVQPGTRTDELGVAFRELAFMQRGLRAALIQKARLAAVGTAVTKISHDLRNILASAQLVSDHLESTEDPNVKRIAPTLLGSIDRAVALCTKTLSFVQEGATQLEVTRFALGPLLDELADTAAGIGEGGAVLDSRVDARLELHADRDQLYRVLLNLVRNAFEAGASRITILAHAEVSQAIIEVSDNGPGLPSWVRGHLFQPFTGSSRAGGSGLGLAIARDLMRGHGGDIALVRTGADGTIFRLTLPVEPRQGERPAPTLVHG